MLWRRACQRISASAPPSTVPRVTLSEAPRNWQLMDETVDHVPGISVERAMSQLLAGKAPKQTVLVAIIDLIMPGVIPKWAILAPIFIRHRAPAAQLRPRAL